MSEISLLPEPIPPEDWECCGSDCGDACVWELYYREKAAYDAQQRHLAEVSSMQTPIDSAHRISKLDSDK
ncbi:oxidoreductase-like domain-containing protein [Snodgrassella sp. CFCC 13594]|uniref:oxidoreductase-like domain-containing protein n=1 Tax=Snodgrassella sp. CFCC 13594 TaxID=1775559 RepID=UPI000836485F|nr:oxidoreductase-like domain-containing protein [Snodgrassella sp. CFCC 13594]